LQGLQNLAGNQGRPLQGMQDNPPDSTQTYAGYAMVQTSISSTIHTFKLTVKIMALNIKQINQFQLKYLRMAGFLEYVQQIQMYQKFTFDAEKKAAATIKLPNGVMTW
jgi:hypothetical protein